MPRIARIAALLVVESLLAAAIGWAFWHDDLRYSLPTPRPAGYNPPSLGDRPPQFPAALLALTAQPTRATVAHFFNPACPCSRFNLEHLRKLVSEYADRVRFVAVLETDGRDNVAVLEDFHALDVRIEAIVDADGEIARQLGVYATPQAVVISREGRLVFRGNYNLGRYCTDPRTEFVRLAIDDCLSGNVSTTWPAAATTAIGCELPSNATLVAEPPR